MLPACAGIYEVQWFTWAKGQWEQFALAGRNVLLLTLMKTARLHIVTVKSRTILVSLTINF